MENLAASRKDELEQALAGKAEAERQLKAMLAGNAQKGARPDSAVFDATAGAPERLRAALEEARVLKEQVRQYKIAARANEKAASAQQSALVSATEQNRALRGKLEAARAGLVPANHDQLEMELRTSERVRHDLEQRLAILTKSKESDLKKYRLAVASAKREGVRERGEKAAMQAQLEAKDKALRAEKLRARALERKADPIRRFEAEARAMAAHEGRLAEEARLEALRLEMAPLEAQARADAEAAVAAAAAAAEPPVVVRIVLVGGDETSEAAADAAAAADATAQAGVEVALQELIKDVGETVRADEAAHEAAEQEAATRVQAAARGRLARKQVAAMREEEAKAKAETEARETVQAGPTDAPAAPPVEAPQEAAAAAPEPAPPAEPVSKATKAAPGRRRPSVMAASGRAKPSSTGGIAFNRSAPSVAAK